MGKLSNRVCAVDGCGRPHSSKGLCGAHAKRRRKGVPVDDTPIRVVGVGVSRYERVMRKSMRVGQCLEFQGARLASGYGRVDNIGTHVIVWEHHNGPVPDGLLVRHSCDNPPCVNIDHLLIGTMKDNRQDAVSRGRTARGERHGRAKLTDEQVLAIRDDDRTAAELSLVYGVNENQIRDIKKGRAWGHL